MHVKPSSYGSKGSPVIVDSRCRGLHIHVVHTSFPVMRMITFKRVWYSRPLIIQTSIIRTLNYLGHQNNVIHGYIAVH